MRYLPLNGHRHQRYANAIAPLQSSLEKAASSDDKGVVLSNLAHSYIKLGRLEEALSSVRKSIDLNKTWAEAHYNYALILIGLRDYEKARLELEEAIRLDDDNVCRPSAQKQLDKLRA